MMGYYGLMVYGSYNQVAILGAKWHILTAVGYYGRMVYGLWSCVVELSVEVVVKAVSEQVIKFNSLTFIAPQNDSGGVLVFECKWVTMERERNGLLWCVYDG